MNERILNLLSLCMQAKEKGHDCFFDYSPHVNMVRVRIYKNGWKVAIFDEAGAVLKSFEDKEFEAHIFHDDTWSQEEIDAQISSIEDYLKGLIEWQAQD